MTSRLLGLLGPPYQLPTWKEIAVTVTVVALARGWYDAEQKYEDMLAVAKTSGREVVECRVALDTRAVLLEERVELAEERTRILLAWITSAGVEIPELPRAD